MSAKMKSIFLAFLLIFFLSHIASADNTQPLSSSCTSGYVVLFGNGVNNDPVNNILSKGRIRAYLGKNYNNEPITYGFLPNPGSNGSNLLLDLLTVFEQKMAEDPTLSWSIFLDFINGRTVNHAIVNFLSDYFLNIQIDPTVQLKQQLAQFSQYSDSTVNNQVTLLTTQLTQGKKVMVVAHSQGNLYANAAYYKLASNPNIDIGAFGIAGVANPANEVAGGTPPYTDRYVTSKNDMVINALRALQPATLPYNDTSVPINTDDLLGHGFLEIYMNLNYASIRSHTTSVMDATLSGLHSNIANTNGPVTATLVWDIPGDVDLHIYEPSGTHVYYAARQGQAGYLDRDDTVGTGPEHYYTSCQNPIPGTYQFGVNYYAGSGAKTATVRLDVLGQILPGRSVVLPQARYSSGNNSPSILFNLNLIENQDGTFSYTLQ
jgi:hypothetical protein